MNQVDKEWVLSRTGFLTAGELIDFINKYNIPMDAPILIQRIEDIYYNGYSIAGMRGTLEDGTGGILPEGTMSQGWPVYLKDGDYEDCPSQYHPASTPIYYKEDPEVLFINLHY